MPVSVQQVDGKYRVSTPNQTHAFGTSKAKAKRQANLLRAIDHGWKPTGEEARDKRESAHDIAVRVVNKLLEAPRDDIGSVPIPASGKAYARIHGMGGLQKKQQLYINMGRDLANRGKPTHGFKDYAGSAYNKHEALDELLPMPEGWDNAPVTSKLEKSRTEKTTLHGGKYGKGVDPKGKTGGKFTFPKNYKVGHAMKS